LNDKAYVGPTAKLRGYMTSLLGSEGGLATGTFNELVGELTLDSLKTTFGGNPTEGERAALIALQASVNKPEAQRKQALERVVAVLARREAFERQRAGELRGGTYYKPGGGTPSGGTPAPAAPSGSGSAPAAGVPQGWQVQQVR
ncbi:MAG: hypothetical protein IT537_04660, partial [Hyphomicrobiales bacterium]|nr:hypothetical protein [Hyphomicrobiales bacterium]